MINSKISIIVPTFKEVENIPILTERVHKAMIESNFTYELIIVDDNSQDGSEDTVSRLAAMGFNVRVIIRKNERGLSSAVLRGLTEAKGEIYICMDADLSHPPETIPLMAQKILKDDAEFVVGSRYIKGGVIDSKWTLYRWLYSKVATMLARPFTNIKDPMSGFFALPAKVFKRSDQLNAIGYKIGLELIVKSRCHTVIEVPIYFSDRIYGVSKLDSKEILNYLRLISKLWGYKLNKRTSKYMQ